jgi:hypothetical protein
VFLGSCLGKNSCKAKIMHGSLSKYFQLLYMALHACLRVFDAATFGKRCVLMCAKKCIFEPLNLH